MKKRILYIHHGQGLGGAPLSLLALIKTLDRTRYHPMVLFLWNSEVIDLYKQQGIEVYGPVGRSDFSHTAIWNFKWYHLPYLVRAIKDTIITACSTAHIWFDRLQPNLVHLNTSSLIAWGYVAHKKKIPVVWHIREPLAPGYFGLRKKLITSCVSRYATIIISISNNDAKPWATDHRTHIIPNPVDHTVFNPESFTNKNPVQPTILFVGGMSREKGTFLILKVFQQLLTRVPNAHLVIAGYFDRTKKFPFYKKFFPEYRFVKAVDRLYSQLATHVTLTGPTTRIPELLSSATALVFPATVGHFARPVIEAGFMKKPVIASRLAPLDELVIDGATGFLCHAGNIDQWANKLECILSNQELCQNIGLNAYTFCRQRFNLGTYGEKIGIIYTSFWEDTR
ncbi:MAG: glycosyltransferase family 4 protein [Candidatus Babeliales bacterium]